MEILIGKNTANQDLNVTDKHFKYGNFAQQIPFTEIPAKDCIFEACNLGNCAIDSSCEIINCYIGQVETKEDRYIIYNQDGTILREELING